MTKASISRRIRRLNRIQLLQGQTAVIIGSDGGIVDVVSHGPPDEGQLLAACFRVAASDDEILETLLDKLEERAKQTKGGSDDAE